MRIAILTFHRAVNCGAMLQAWALQVALEQMGHVTEFPICNYVGDDSRKFHFVREIPVEKRGVARIRSFLGRLVLDLKRLFRRKSESFLLHADFRKRFLKERDCKVKDFLKHYDLAVVGSDQVWNIGLTGNYRPLFLGEVVPSAIPVVAYAASYGDQKLDDNGISRLVKALDRFKAISVREPLVKSQLEEHGRRDVCVVADPTLLLDACEYERIRLAKRSSRRYLYFYTLFATDFEMSVAKYLCKELGVELVMTVLCRKPGDSQDDAISRSIGPSEMVTYIADADYVVAGSFHGTALAVIHHKKFLSIRAQVDQAESRPAALLNRIGLSSHLVNPSIPLEEMAARIRESFPEAAEVKLKEFADESRDWLKRSIAND